MSLAIQSNLYNCYGIRTQCNVLSQLFGDINIEIKSNGTIREIRPHCPKCDSSNTFYNGSDNVTPKILNNFGLTIRYGHYGCKDCGHTWEFSRDYLKKIKEAISQWVLNIICDLHEKHLSDDHISGHLKTVHGIPLSGERVRQLIDIYIEKIQEEPITYCSGIVIYDEQHPKKNGDCVYRLTGIDAITNKVLFDLRFEDKRKKTIIKCLKQELSQFDIEVMIVDFARGYPKILKEAISKNVKIQGCLFHLAQLIVRDFESLKKRFGRYKRLPLQQLYNMYLMLNIFYNHSADLKKLESLMKALEQRKEGLKHNRDMSNDKINQNIHKYESKLIFSFSTHLKLRELMARRVHCRITEPPLREHEDTKNIFDNLKFEGDFLPKQARKRLEMIDKNWEMLTLCQKDKRVPPTSSKIENYYKNTLKAFQKKKFRSDRAVEHRLKISKLSRNGQIWKPQMRLCDIFKMLSWIVCFFTLH